jgi:hypothetical protein
MVVSPLGKASTQTTRDNSGLFGRLGHVFPNLQKEIALRRTRRFQVSLKMEKPLPARIRRLGRTTLEGYSIVKSKDNRNARKTGKEKPYSPFPR